MYSSYTHRILARATGATRLSPGDSLFVPVDLLVAHDMCGPGMIRVFERECGQDARVWNAERVVLVADHCVHTSDEGARRNVRTLREFAAKQGVRCYFGPTEPNGREVIEFNSADLLGRESIENTQGISHVLLAERGMVGPGQIVVGTDSHTCTAGALGAFAVGVGMTDAAFVLATGTVLLRVPEVVRFYLQEKLCVGVTAKDAALAVLTALGPASGAYRAIEFTGDGVAGFSSADRMVLANMVAEAEAKTAVFEVVDSSKYFPQTCLTCVDTRSEPGHETAGAGKPHTDYELNLTTLEPLVAGPDSMWTCSAVYDRGHVPVDLAYIGGCSGGQLGDFLAAASVLKGRQVVVNTVGVPATAAIVRSLKTREDGGDCTWDILESAGVQMSEGAGCGACFGGFADTMGRLHGPMTCVSTLGRLSPGRLGHEQARMYLANPLTVAASAIAGQITDPREYLA